MSAELPIATSVSQLSPSALATLRACPLKFAFGRAAPKDVGPIEAHQVLGVLCHSVLERVVANRSIFDDNWGHVLEEAWSNELAALIDEHNASPPQWMQRPPQAWPGLLIKKARLGHAAGRLRALLLAAHDAELVIEQEMVALDGRLRGFPDLVVRDPGAHWVIDYKTGAVLDEDGGLPKALYVRQLMLYTLLEHEASGRWPTVAYLVPLRGEPIEVAVDPAACTALGNELVDELDGYNALLGEVPPARPEPGACQWCSAAARCPELWATADDNWEGLTLVEGIVTEAVPTRAGISLVINADGGTVAAGRITVRVSPSDHPFANSIASNSRVRLASLHRRGESSDFVLPPRGQLEVVAA